MKYSIFGFNQSRILSLQKNKNEKIIKLDITDLLILKDVADFMNRSKVIKYTIDDKVFFSVQYATILEDLPILDIKKQALSDRLDKMCILGLLEKKVIKNQAGTFVAFRMGENYESLIYTPTSSELQVQAYQTTTHNTNITNTNNIEKEDNKLSSKKSEIDFNFIQQEWERINPNLSSIRAINPKRKNAICTLLKNNKANIDDLIMAFKIISICSFCQGDNDRKWKASFDWIINDTNSCFNRLFEGNYARGSDEKYRIEMLLKGEENVLSQENVNNNNIWQGL